MKIRDRMPQLEGVESWLNSRPLQREDFLGEWTLISFWSLSCNACEQQYKRLQHMAEQYKQLRWMSVHMPRTETDKNVKHIRQQIKVQKRAEPIAIDEQLLLTDRFGVRFVPSYYVFDEAGRLRYYQGGERSLALLGQRLERFLTK